MSQQIFGAAAAVIALNRAFNDESPANAVFQNQLAAAQADAANGFANFAKAFSASFAGLSNAELAAQVMGNMGLLPNDALEAALVDYLNGPGATNRGLVVLQLATILTGLEHATGNLSVYNAAAAAWNSEITNAYTYSADPANTVPSGDETTAGKTFMLTEGIDGGSAFLGTAANDTYNAYPVPKTTLGKYDALDGGAGNDVFNIFVANGHNAEQVGSVKNIETINIDNSDAGDQLFGGNDGIDASKFVGATTINQIGQANDINHVADTTTVVLTDASTGDITVSAAATAASANVNLVDAVSYVTDDGFNSYTSYADSSEGATLTVDGAALNTVTVTGGAKTLAAGDKVDGKTLINDTSSLVNLDVDVAQKSLTVNADSALHLIVHGDKLTSLDTTGVANGVEFYWGDNNSVFDTLNTVKTGAGDDYVQLTTHSVKDVASSVADETVNVSVDTGAGNDYLGISAYGDGQTTIATGEGDDDMGLWVETRDGHAIGKVNADLGAGDDTLHLNSSLASTLTKLVGSTVTTSDVKLAGGEGNDTLSIYDSSIESALYDRIGLNVSGFETLEFRNGAIDIDASKLSQFSTLSFGYDHDRSDLSSVTKVAADQTIEFYGYVDLGEKALTNLDATAAGFVHNDDPAKTTYAGTLNAVWLDDAAGQLTAHADVVNLTVSAKLYDIETNFKEDVGTWGNSSFATIAEGNEFQTLHATLQSVSTTGVNAGYEKVSGLGFGVNFATNKDGYATVADDSIHGVKSVVVSGQGHAVVNANAVSGSTLTTIDLSGMTALVNLNNKGEQVTGWESNSQVYGYENLSTSIVFANDAVAETIKLGGAQDTVITGSLGNKMDTITGFELAAKGSNADVAKSDDIDVTTAVYVDGNDFAKVKIDAGNSTLALALDQVAKSGVDQALFTLGGNTYIFVDESAGAGAGTYDANADTLIKLVGTYDLDLLAQVVHGTIDPS